MLDTLTGKRVLLCHMEPLEETLTTAEVAKIFRVSRNAVRKWVVSGWIPAFRTPGGAMRFRRADVDAVLTRDAMDRSA